jgi:hypothetical protein
MSQTKHTQEPEIKDRRLYVVNFADGTHAISLDAPNGKTGCRIEGPHARAVTDRIGECWLACTGMTDPEKEVAELRKQRDELAVACEAVALLADSLLDSENLTDHDCPATCPACSSRWSVRECRIMLHNLSGKCQCGKWSFDVRAAIKNAGGGQ